MSEIENGNKFGQDLVDRLFHACATGDIGEIRKCAEAQADVNMKLLSIDEEGNSGEMRWPLMIAVKNSQSLAVMHLLGLGAKPDMGPDSELAVAEGKNMANAIELLVMAGADPNRGELDAPLNSAYVRAIQNAFIPRARKYMEHGADVNHGLYMYQWGYDQERVEQVKFKDKLLPIAMAVRYNNLDFMIELIKAGAKLDVHLRDGHTVLAHICASGIERFSWYVGLNIPNLDKYKSKTGKSFLQSVYELSSRDAKIHYLIAAGACVEDTPYSKYRQPALFFAVKLNDPQLTLRALENGGDMDAVVDDGKTIYQLAQELERETALKVLDSWRKKGNAKQLVSEMGPALEPAQN